MDPLTLLLYLLVGLVILGIVWYAMLWIGVPTIPARIFILVVALLLLIWILQGGHWPGIGYAKPLELARIYLRLGWL